MGMPTPTQNLYHTLNHTMEAFEEALAKAETVIAAVHVSIINNGAIDSDAVMDNELERRAIQYIRVIYNDVWGKPTSLV